MLQSAKLVVAVVEPRKFDAVLAAVKGVGAEAPTVTEVRSYRRNGRTESYRGLDYTPGFVPMLKIEIDAPSEQVNRLIDAIAEAGRVEGEGEVKIRVLSVERDQRFCLVEGDRTPPRRAA